MEKMFRRPYRPFTPKQNQLLAALPDADYQRLPPHLELVPLTLDSALCESGSPQGFE